MRVNQPSLNETEKEWLRLCLEYLDALGGKCEETRFKSYIVRLSGMMWTATRLMDYMVDNGTIKVQDGTVISIPYIIKGFGKDESK